MLITPTVGRVVWYYKNRQSDQGQNVQPQAALVVYVHSERSVNLGVFDQGGNTYGLASVTLVQEGDTVPAPGTLGYCCWMPYQLIQAGKAAPAAAASGSVAKP